LLLIFLRCRFQVEGQGKEADTAPEDTVRERIIQQEVNLDLSGNLEGNMLQIHALQQ
jgi:hypothetical protein